MRFHKPFVLVMLGIVVGSAVALALAAQVASSQSHKSSPPQMQPGCITPEQLAAQWPPLNYGRIAFGQRELDLSKIPFEQVHLMNIACGIVRGEGVDDFVAYSVKAEYGRVRVLAVYERDRRALVNVGILVRPAEGAENPDMLKVADLRLENLTGDDRPQVVFTAGDPGCASWVSVWGLRGGTYGDLLTTTEHGCLGIANPAGDGGKPIVFWDTPPQFQTPEGDRLINARVWPNAVYRWNNQEFRKSLVPPAFAKFTDYVERNREKLKDLQNDEDLLLALGRAYELQGKHALALEQYARAWGGDNYNYQASDIPADWSDQQRAELVLSSYYGVLNQPLRLTEAYGRFARDIRNPHGFADFAATMARIESITTDGRAQVAKVEGNTITATLRLIVKELAENGETERPYIATWQIRRTDCALLAGSMKPL